jgi:hypothetical protein
MSRVTYNVPLPVQPVDGAPVWTKAEIYRAADVAGIPGVFSKIATVTLSTTGRWGYRYEDDAASGTLDDWYYHRYADTAVALFSDPSEQVQVDEFLAILWALGDITDDDVDINAVTQWCNQAITDMWTEGVWMRYPSGSAERTAALITPTTDADNGSVDERYTIPADLFEVCRVERLNATTSKHENWLYMGVEWEQEDREVRLIDAESSTSALYMMHGKRRFRDIAELDESHYQLIYWMIRKQYLDFRVNKRANTPRFQVFDRKSDTTPEQLRWFLQVAQVEVDRRMGPLKPAEYPYDIAPGIAV